MFLQPHTTHNTNVSLTHNYIRRGGVCHALTSLTDYAQIQFHLSAIAGMASPAPGSCPRLTPRRRLKLDIECLISISLGVVHGSPIANHFVLFLPKPMLHYKEQI